VSTTSPDKPEIYQNIPLPSEQLTLHSFIRSETPLAAARQARGHSEVDGTSRDACSCDQSHFRSYRTRRGAKRAGPRARVSSAQLNSNQLQADGEVFGETCHSVQDGSETDAEESDAQAELRSACSAGMLFQFQKCRADPGRSPLRACRANA
jgi:hypothetical protein